MKMLLTHLVCGIVVGLGAALAIWIAGLPAWIVVFAYALGLNFGVLASALALYLWPPEDLKGAEVS
jgi:hypothetical protein